MTQTRHCCAIDVRGMLRNHSKPGSLAGLFITEGRPCTDEEARIYLYGCLRDGKTIIPGDSKCDNFSYEQGRCMGHPMNEEAANEPE